jgi:chromosome segregation ATPase
VNKQSQAVVPIAMESDKATHEREMAELESRLNQTLAGALEEANLRRAVEEREAESRRLLRLAEEELQLLRDSSQDGERRRSVMEEERRGLLDRVEQADEARQKAEEKINNLEAENEAMQHTLEEYRLSSTKWRQDIDEAKRQREALQDTIGNLEQQLQEGHESSTTMKRRLEKLHSDMATAAGQLASEKAVWKAREDDYRSRCESLEAAQAAQARQRHELEEELRVARASIAELTEARAVLDQTRSSNGSLEELVRKLQSDLAEQQSLAARWERDFHDAREAGRAEVQRTRLALETDIESANHQVNLIRAELESGLIKARSELETARMEAETAKARHERLVEEEENARREALRKVNHANSVALDEARSKHEATLQEMATQHARQLQYAVEDKERSEYILNERLALAEAKLQHSNDRILHLQERLEVAKSAAQAAAMNAQTRGAQPQPAPASSNLPEKISPQALRESILVLQEQLQDRESQIEKLQTELKEAPAQLKERDSEISWLRELLAVRSEDLTELINTLAKPSFDRDAVRDIAIRIHANLQMEQQEKERFGYGAQSLGGQALATLANFATPKATSFTSAFNKWRSTMESSALKNAQRGPAPASAHRRTATPSRGSTSAIPPSLMAGLMTPPASNVRNTPSPETTMSLPPPRLQSRAESKQPEPAQQRQSSISSDRPTTPLFRPQSYDQDAEDSKVTMQDFGDEDLDIADSEPPAFRSLEAELEADGDASPTEAL